MGCNFRRDPEDHVLDLLGFHCLCGEKGQIIGPPVIQIKKPKRTSAREEKALLLSKPFPQKVPLQRSAGLRVFPAHVPL